MAGPTRPTPPSAFDGYRRLERTRRVAAQAPVQAATAVVPPRRAPVRGSRIAGFVRLACFVSVLAIIVATSVGLASADTRAQAQRETAVQADASPEPAGASRVEPESEASAVDVAGRASDDAPGIAGAANATTPKDDVQVPVAGATTAPSAARPARLPFTGEPSLDRFLVAGAALVLLGMLLQIAGQPLPDRARARVR